MAENDVLSLISQMQKTQNYQYCVLIDHITKIEARLNELQAGKPKQETKQTQLPATETLLFIRDLNKVYMDDERIGRHILQGTLNQLFLDYGLVSQSPSGKTVSITPLGRKTGWIIDGKPILYSKEKADQYIVMMLKTPKQFKQYLKELADGV